MGYMNEQLLKIIAKDYVDSKSTIREMAKKYGVSKTHLHHCFSKRLEHVDKDLYEEVKKQLKINLNARYVRGGKACQIKMYIKKRTK